MNRARDEARGSRRPSHYSVPRAGALGLAVVVAVALLTALAACDASTGTPGAVSTPSSADPGGSASPEGTVAGSGSTADPSATGAPASPSPGNVATPSPSGGPVDAAAECSGSLANRDFFSAVATAVDWDVYCGVLPDGWFVDDPSSYRLRDGGQMIVTYRGPNGARLQLREGAFCSDENGCVPSGQDSGPATFGGRDGTLVALEGGGYAVVVDRGAPLSWLAIGANLEEAEFRGLAAALRIVGR